MSVPIDVAYNAAFVSRFYDVAFEDEWAEAAPSLLAFLASLASSDVGVERLCDAGCGCGHLLERIAAHERFASWSVQGFDLSHNMAEAASRRLADRGVVRVGDLCEWEADGGPVGILTCTFGVLNQLPSEDSVRAAFRAAASNLVPGGIFVLDAMTQHGHGRMASSILEDNVKRDGGLYLSTGIRLGPDRIALRELVFLPSDKAPGHFDRIEGTDILTYFATDVIVQAASDAGFRLRSAYPSYQGLADDASLSEPTTPLASDWLEAHGRVKEIVYVFVRT